MTNFIANKVAVLGAGVMGAQIAAHLVNVKVPVVLFDLPAKEGPKNGIVSKAVDGLKKLKPAPLGDAADARLIQQAMGAQPLFQAPGWTRTNPFAITTWVGVTLPAMALPLRPKLEPSTPRLVVSSLPLACQRSRESSRCCSSGVSWRQRSCITSPPRRPINRPPQSTASIGEPVSRSALVTSVSPSTSTTAPQAASRGRLSSGLSRGSSITASPTARARLPLRLASMA